MIEFMALPDWSELPWHKKAVVVLLFMWKACTWIIKHNWKGKHMEKPFDFKELGKRLEAAGMPIAKDAGEDIAEKVFKEVSAWIKDSVIATPNKFDDFMIPVLSTLEPTIMKAIDKIDGKEG